MKNLNEVVTFCDFYHCVNRDGFVFTSVTKPANIFDGIVIRNPENCEAVSPKKAPCEKTLAEHIELINKYKLEKACIIAENIDFITQCPSLKYLEIIPAKTAPQDFDYSPLYNMPEIKYIDATTEEYGFVGGPLKTTTIDYSRINGLEEIWARGKGHLNYNYSETLKRLFLIDSKIDDLTVLENCKNLEELDLTNTGIKSLKGIEKLDKLKDVAIYYERKLNDLSDIVSIHNNIEQFAIKGCPKIKDFSFLNSLNKIKYLQLSGNNKIPDLYFIENMPELNVFTFSFVVENGDLTPCLKVPCVNSLRDRRHYNLKDKNLPKV